MHVMYSIRPGDTLARIATAHEISLGLLLAFNPQIDNPNLIFPGQVILVPGARPNLASELAEENNPVSEPNWLKIARREEGVREISGPQHEVRILEYLAVCTNTSEALRAKDETAWCSAFACWVMEEAGFESPRTAWARTWYDARWGNEEDIGNPRVGALAVFSRGEGGHVGFFLEDLGSKVKILGGNQGNRVKVSTYPKSGVMSGTRYELLGYRWPEVD